MKILSIFMFVVMLSCLSLFGQMLLKEDFNYLVGSRLTANGWTAHSAAGTNSIATIAQGLNYGGINLAKSAAALSTLGEDLNRISCHWWCSHRSPFLFRREKGTATLITPTSAKEESWW